MTSPMLPERSDDDTRGTIAFHTLFSEDRTPTSGLTAGSARLEPGEQFASHRHEQPEVYLVLPSRGVVQLGDDEVTVGAGTSVFVPSGIAHAVRNAGQDDLEVFDVLAADGIGEVDYDFLRR